MGGKITISLKELH